MPADVGDGHLKLVFGARGRVEGDLRLERAHQIGGGIDDRPAEFENGMVRAGQMLRQTGGIRIQADAQQRVLRRPCLSQAVNEFHGLHRAAIAYGRRRAGTDVEAAAKAASGCNGPAPGFTAI